MRRFFVRKEGQFASIRRKYVPTGRVSTHLGGVHEARIGNEQGTLAGAFIQSHEDTVMPVHTREKIMKS